jgi:hypothetical protein
MAGTLTSSDIDVREVKTGSVQAVYTGSPTGSLTINVSNDPTNLGYTTLYTQAISAAGSYFQPLADVGYCYIQIKYTPSGGTGTLNVKIAGKSV